jgi:hypothetical protein
VRPSLTASRFRVVSAFALLALGVTLVGCAPEAQLSAAGGGPASPTDHNIADTAGAGDHADTEASTTDPETCLHGTWLANNDFFLASIREFGDEVKSVSGEVTLAFHDDGTVRTEYRGWIISSEVEGMSVKIERNGTDHGTFAVTDDTVTIEETSVSSALVMTGEGFNMTVDAAPVNYHNAGYTCDERSATISTTDGTLQLDRQ